MGAKIAIAHFWCKKVWSWVGGWMDGTAGLRITYSKKSGKLQLVCYNETAKRQYLKLHILIRSFIRIFHNVNLFLLEIYLFFNLI